MKIVLFSAILLSTSVIASLANYSQYEKTGYSGMVTTVKKNFMDEYKNVLLDNFLNNLKEVRLQDTSTSINAKLATIHASVSNM